MSRLKLLAPWVGHHIIRVKADINFNLPPRPLFIDQHGQETYDPKSIKLDDAGASVLDADGVEVLVTNGLAFRDLADGSQVAKATYGTIGLVISVANEDESEVRNYRTNQEDLTHEEVLGLAQVGASAVGRFATIMGISAPGFS
jgi:hypothetical protein